MYDNYIPPGGMGFQINIDDLPKALNEDKYANILCVIDGGLESLYARAVSIGFEPKSEGYSHKCGLCFDIKKYILGKTDAGDIGPHDFFDEY